MLTQYQFDMRETEAICGPLPYAIEDGVRITADWIKWSLAEREISGGLTWRQTGSCVKQRVAFGS